MKRSKLGFWLFLAPCLISFAIVVLIPTVIGIYYSLTDWKGSGNANFIGFENYIKLFTMIIQISGILLVIQLFLL